MREFLYALLGCAVERQGARERIETVGSSGLPHYRIPHSMDRERGACCYIRRPCEVHALYCGACGRAMLNPEHGCLSCGWRVAGNREVSNG